MTSAAPVIALGGKTTKNVFRPQISQMKDFMKVTITFRMAPLDTSVDIITSILSLIVHSLGSIKVMGEKKPMGGKKTTKGGKKPRPFFWYVPTENDRKCIQLLHITLFKHVSFFEVQNCHIDMFFPRSKLNMV